MRKVSQRMFKVLIREQGILRSIASGKAMVIYKVGRWVRAPRWLREKGYHLFCFNNLEAAEEFAWSLIPGFDVEIWEAEVSVVYPQKPLRLRLEPLSTGVLVEAIMSGWPGFNPI